MTGNWFERIHPRMLINKMSVGFFREFYVSIPRRRRLIVIDERGFSDERMYRARHTAVPCHATIATQLIALTPAPKLFELVSVR